MVIFGSLQDLGSACMNNLLKFIWICRFLDVCIVLLKDGFACLSIEMLLTNF